VVTLLEAVAPNRGDRPGANGRELWLWLTRGRNESLGGAQEGGNASRRRLTMWATHADAIRTENGEIQPPCQKYKSRLR